MSTPEQLEAQLEELAKEYGNRFLLEPERREPKGVFEQVVRLLHHGVVRLRVPHVDGREREVDRGREG